MQRGSSWMVSAHLKLKPSQNMSVWCQQTRAGIRGSPELHPVEGPKSDHRLRTLTYTVTVSFYGFSLDKGSTLADLWATSLKPAVTPDLSCWNSTLDGGNSTIPLWNEFGIPAWQTDYANPCSTIYDTLLDQAKQYLVTVSIASIAGTACYTFAANRLHRRQFLTASFLLLMVLFLITGGVVSNFQRYSLLSVLPKGLIWLAKKSSISINPSQYTKPACQTAAVDTNDTNLRYRSTMASLTRLPPQRQSYASRSVTSFSILVSEFAATE